MDKYKLLKKGILFDLIGLATMFVPFWGTIIDLIWAPYAAFQINKMYRGTQGKIAAVVVFSRRNTSRLRYYTHFYLDVVVYFYLEKKRRRCSRKTIVNKKSPIRGFF